MTQKQRIFFFRLFQKACSARGIPPAEREAYRHNLIAHACPLSGGSLRNVGSGEDFDRLMRALSREAQSAEASQHFTTADARRVAKMCEACARQVWEIAAGLPGKVRGNDKSNGAPNGAHDEREALRGSPEAMTSTSTMAGASRPHDEREALRGSPEGDLHRPQPNRSREVLSSSLSSSLSSPCVAYLRAIMAQAGWRWAIVASGDGWWLDLPLPHAQKLFQMLDTHRRRLLRRVGAKWELTAEGEERPMRLAFRANGHYEWRAAALWLRPWKQEGPEPRQATLRVRVRVMD